MDDSGLLTPNPRCYSNWIILQGLIFINVYCIWQAMQARFLSRDCVELSVLDIDITLKSVYYSALSICQLVAGGVSSFLKKYGIKLSSIYLGAISIIAYVLVVYVLGSAEIQITRLCRNLLVDPLEKSVVEIEETRGPIKVRHLMEKVPYSLEEHTKYTGEDVQFECYRFSSSEEEVISPYPNHVEWSKNGQIIHASDHINITWSFESISETVNDEIHMFHYMTSSILKITFIEPDDYGNYSCSISPLVLVLKPDPPPMCPLQEPVTECICFLVCFDLQDTPRLPPSSPPPPPPRRLELPVLSDSEEDTNVMTKRVLVKVFSLVKMKDKVRKVEAPPGGIVSFSATYDNFNDHEDVSFDYNIGGQDFDSICDGFMKGCSLTVLYYWLFLHEHGHFYTYASIWNSVRMKNAITGTGWQCVCKGSYNVHSFSFYRPMFNVTSGREEIWEAQYPHRILLAPRSPDLFFYNFSDSIDPVAKEPCWINSLKNTYSDVCKQDETTVEWIMWIFAMLERTILGIILVVLFGFASLFIRLMNTYILMPIRNRILEGSWFTCKGCVKTNNIFGCIKDDKSDPKYEVYISYDYEEHHLHVSEQLASIIESFGYTTFHPTRDILAGNLFIDAVSNAICASKKFVVLLTKEYIENGLCNRLEFQLLLHMVLNKSVNYDKLLIINRDNCYIPEPLKYCCVLEWERNIDEETLVSKRAILYNWVQGKVVKGNICNCF